MKKILTFLIIMVSLLLGCEKNNIKVGTPTYSKESKGEINQDFNKNIPSNKSNLTVVNCQIMFANGAYGMRGYKVDLSNGISPHLFFCKKNMRDCKNGLNLTKLNRPEKPDNSQPESPPPYETDSCFTIEK